MIAVNAPDDKPDTYMGLSYRTGRHNPRNLYRVTEGDDHRTDEHIGCVFDENDGPWVAAALDVWAAATRDVAAKAAVAPPSTQEETP